jgi:hypothetical protein
MVCLKYSTASFALAIAASFGMNIAWPSQSFAESVYVFTFTGNPLSNPGWNADGSFSIPVEDFTSATVSYNLFGITPPDPGVQLYNSDIVAESFTITAPDGSATLSGLSFVIPTGYNNFDVSGALPQVVVQGGNYLIQSPAGCNPFITNCQGFGLYVFYSGIGISGPYAPNPNGGFYYAGTQMGGTWTTSLGELATPLPAALPLFAGGLGVLGLIAGRKKRKAVGTCAA